MRVADERAAQLINIIFADGRRAVMQVCFRTSRISAMPPTYGPWTRKRAKCISHSGKRESGSWLAESFVAGFSVQ